MMNPKSQSLVSLISSYCTQEMCELILQLYWTEFSNIVSSGLENLASSFVNLLMTVDNLSLMRYRNSATLSIRMFKLDKNLTLKCLLSPVSSLKIMYQPDK